MYDSSLGSCASVSPYTATSMYVSRTLLPGVVCEKQVVSL